MNTYIIYWDSGYGKEYAEVNAESEDIARDLAYESWREAAESEADYSVIGISTEDLREEWL